MGPLLIQSENFQALAAWRWGLAAKQRQAEQERLAAEQRKAEEERLAALRQAEELAAQQRKAEEERLAEQKAG